MTKVLYVEDNEDNVYMLSRRLKRKGFDVVIAGDGAEGVELGHSAAPQGPWGQGAERKRTGRSVRQSFLHSAGTRRFAPAIHA